LYAQIVPEIVGIILKDTKELVLVVLLLQNSYNVKKIITSFLSNEALDKMLLCLSPFKLYQKQN